MNIDRIWIRSAAALSLSTALIAFARAAEAEPAAILRDVAVIAAPGTPGTVCVFGKDAFILADGPLGRDNRVPIIAASPAGKGRVAVFGHDGFFSKDALAIHDTGKLMSNLVRWSAGKENPRVGVVGIRDLAAALKARGFDAIDIDRKTWRSQIGNCAAVFFYRTIPENDDDVAALRAYIENGGGALLAMTPWAFAQGGRSLATDLPANRLLCTMGLAFADGYSGADKGAGGIRISQPIPRTLHVGSAIDLLAGTEKLSKPELAQAELTVMNACRLLPASAAPLKRLRELALGKGPLGFSPEKPLKSTNPLARAAVALELRELNELPNERLKAHPLAEQFPGPVPADAGRVERAVDIDTAIPRWHSTGLYAPPGESLTITLPANALDKGLRVRIGAHTDHTWHLASWGRVPDISRRFDLSKPVTRAGNPFGGLVYVEVPADRTGIVPVKIAGAVEAPLFVLGKTDVQQWKSAIRKSPAPWAELATDKLIITLKAEAVRDLDDPTPILQHWRKVLDACATLAAWPVERKSPERIVSDANISAGYMHSGYPIMTHLDVTRAFIDMDKLRGVDSGWGFYHELGHNHQNGDWTFDGTVEVTVNLFTMYVLETVCGVSKEQAARRALGKPDHLKKYLAKPDFETWKSDPFLALAMYAQLRMEFGWEPFIKTFAEYRALPRAQRPRSDDEKRDQWMVRFSRTVGKNLGPFFQAWGVPTSDAARKSIVDLPTWLPESMTGK